MKALKRHSGYYRHWVWFAGDGKASPLHVDNQSSGEVAITDTGSCLQAVVKQVRCTLITSHLESTASHTAERKRQLKTAFDVIKKHSDKTVIFGGDLNLRDKEVCESEACLY